MRLPPATDQTADFIETTRRVFITPQIQMTQFRQILSGKNRVIYEVRQDTVFIHAIIDTRRDMMAFLMARLLR